MGFDAMFFGRMDGEEEAENGDWLQEFVHDKERSGVVGDFVEEEV